ncbi:unnamed protein product [[Candida] boidinii]|uniref:Unnamed protein product n=1 Tax=Candida boidinii TaxID=5477 RepID=A0A9W6WIQ9_CANBO|nr:hypothetical protein B5S30_g2369 [[Candida] boidinii]OWB81661.1 hypothetical protein B5S33_g280 [[Candida] boidinii]GME74075.1 unnamed protein product [[Candida] boidinii]GMF10792.1 unnamed protein product [[Candida] boidinii]GMG39717.1 unnamed protein product [[Candida] boidinii]
MYCSLTQKKIDSMTSGLVKIEMLDYVQQIDSNIKRATRDSIYSEDSTVTYEKIYNDNDGNVDRDNHLNKDKNASKAGGGFILKLSNLLSSGLIERLKALY